MPNQIHLGRGVLREPDFVGPWPDECPTVVGPGGAIVDTTAGNRRITIKKNTDFVEGISAVWDVLKLIEAEAKG
jgi:hypothetical protein